MEGRCLHPPIITGASAQRAGLDRAVVLVADDSLRRDRTLKQRIYARSGIREYWLVAIPDKRLEVYRGPTGAGYRTVSMHRSGDAVAPLARPSAAVAGDDLLP